MKKSLRASIAKTKDKSQPGPFVLEYRHCCDQMTRLLANTGLNISWNPKVREYSIRY